MIHIGQRTREEREKAAGSMSGNEMCPAVPDGDGSAFVQVDRGPKQCALGGGEFEKLMCSEN